MSEDRHRPQLGRGLAARLLFLVVGFILLGEILIFLPSIARFRLVYLEERVAAAHLATIGLVGQPGPPKPALADALLTHAGVLSIVVQREQPALMLGRVPPVDATVMLGGQNWLDLTLAAFETLAHGGQRVLRVIGPAPMEYGTVVDITLAETPLYVAMVGYAKRIALLSLALSVILAVLILLGLRWLVVRPLAEITDKLARFRRRPEDPSQDGRPLRRGDELGIVDRELGAMTRDLRQALAQKTRLAALGEAVGKIHHDLRNTLATALLVSDRLERSADPEVRRVTPRLVQTLDRAIRLCQETLDFARSRPVQPRLARVPLRPLVEEVVASLPPAEPPVEIVNAVPRDVVLDGDVDQLHRLFLNLGRNALAAMPAGGRLTFAATSGPEGLVISVTDTGRGVPESVRAHLFEPFAGSTTNEGTGLGLAICREIARAHGGDLALLASDETGTTFTLSLPSTMHRAAA